MGKKLTKAFTISPRDSRSSHYGQVPTKRLLAKINAKAFPTPREPTVGEHFRDTSPRLTAASVVRDLGLNTGVSENYRKFLDEQARASTNETRFRQEVLQKMLGDRLDSELRRIMADRAVTFFRTVRKSVLSLDDLQKAEPRGGRYYRRITTEKGDHRYYYDPDRYSKRSDAHLSGPEILEKKKATAETGMDKVPGGLADKKKPSDFDPAAVERGRKVEMEHTNDPKVAEEIARDHLTEDPRYYEKLATIEKKSLSKAGVDAAIRNLFNKDPAPDDSTVHALAERLGMEVDDLEERIYKIAGKRLKKGDLTPEKARQILHDGTVHGKPITEQQRKYFGAVSGGSVRKGEDDEGLDADVDKEDADTDVDTEADKDTDEEPKENPFQASMTSLEKSNDFEKSLEPLEKFLGFGGGEGSRGGQIIGHSAGGKPIYASASHPQAGGAYSSTSSGKEIGTTPAPKQSTSDWAASRRKEGWTKKDHDEAANIHQKLADHHQKAGNKAEAKKHREAVEAHNAAYRHVVKLEGEQAQQKRMGKAMGADLTKGEGEGSRGGHVVGHTSSGKPIYEKHVKNVQGFRKDLDDLKQMKTHLKTLQGGGEVPNLTVEGAKKNIAGLEGAIEKKHETAVKYLEYAEKVGPSQLRGEADDPPFERSVSKAASGSARPPMSNPSPSDHGTSGYREPSRGSSPGGGIPWVGPSIEKSAIGELSEVGDDLQKAFPVLDGHVGWADQFSGTPFYTRALELIKECMFLDRENSDLYRNKPDWHAREKMDVVKRAHMEEDERQKSREIDKKRARYQREMRDLEVKLVGAKIEAEKMRKSQSNCEVVMGEAQRVAEEAPEREKRIKTAIDESIKGNGGMDPEAEGEAREELKEQENDPTKGVKKSLEDDMSLENWLSKAEGGMPEGDPGLDEGVEVESKKDGGKVAGVGKTEGGSQNTGNGNRADVGDTPSVESDKLSEDDADVDKQMTTHKKALERATKSLDSSQRVIPDDPVEGERRAARLVSQLRKSRDVSVYVPPMKTESEVDLQKSEAGTTFRVGRGDLGGVRVSYDDSLDRYIEKSIQGSEADAFYPHGRPALGAVGQLASTSDCSECGLQKSAALTACPHCGAGTAVQTSGVMGGGYLVKSERQGPSMQPAAKADVVVLPGGIIVKDE